MLKWNASLKKKKWYGVAKDLTKAVYWLEKSAEQGHVDAQKMLEILKRR